MTISASLRNITSLLFLKIVLFAVLRNGYGLVERAGILRIPGPLLRNKKQVASDFFFISGGACGNQTRDLSNANAALYQLS